VKEFLSREGRAFVERNVDEDEGAYDELVGLGWRAVPVTIVGTRAVRGFDPPALRALVGGS
jgi:hypothetical protein